ncbi:M48 family metallopeptidase [Spirulina sp. 06S082]|uniref:M48 family metallopeptidase n=1 Tax=Spirulina sp. 06S082 TaxID=3110248 RepID=UPI002B1EFD82|nr:M48 family metallopeptidase [Spirulina sp. 06S082]MEA5471614.1 M48 family metallopeptidase [Spirulina sp. 06S082]
MNENYSLDNNLDTVLDIVDSQTAIADSLIVASQEERRILTGLTAEAYEHPFDRKALESLQKMPGMSLLFKKINEYGIDRQLRLQHAGSYFRVTSRSFPDFHQTLIKACQILEISPIPDVYLFQGLRNSYTIGVEAPILCFGMNVLESFDPDELLYIIGHELAHIKSQHLLYHQTATILPTLGTLLNRTTMGISGLATSGIQWALYNWVMMATFTADRAGLLACQNIRAVITSLLQGSGISKNYITPILVEDFVAQAREFEADFDRLDKFAKMFTFMNEEQYPWSVMRTSELLKWYQSGEYEALLHETSLADLKPTEEWGFLSSW